MLLGEPSADIGNRVQDPPLTGYFEVSVHGGAIAHRVRVPINDNVAAVTAREQFDSIQNLAAPAAEAEWQRS